MTLENLVHVLSHVAMESDGEIELVYMNPVQDHQLKWDSAKLETVFMRMVSCLK